MTTPPPQEAPILQPGTTTVLGESRSPEHSLHTVMTGKTGSNRHPVPAWLGERKIGPIHQSTVVVLALSRRPDFELEAACFRLDS